MRGRLSISDFENPVRAVTVRAGSHGTVALGETLAMNAGQVLRQLIHSLLRLELVHQSGVAVAPGTRAGNRRAGDFAHKPFRPAHGQRGIFLCGITTMTGGATEADPRVYVAGEFQSGLCQRAVQGGMTLAAGVPARRDRRQYE
jgi:hypothetical protein